MSKQMSEDKREGCEHKFLVHRKWQTTWMMKSSWLMVWHNHTRMEERLGMFRSKTRWQHIVVVRRRCTKQKEKRTSKHRMCLMSAGNQCQKEKSRGHPHRMKTGRINLKWTWVERISGSKMGDLWTILWGEEDQPKVLEENRWGTETQTPLAD